MDDFLIMNSDGEIIPSDPLGEYLAFLCFSCGHPVLATSRINQRGSHDDHPSKCRGCGKDYVLDVRPHMEKLYIHLL